MAENNEDKIKLADIPNDIKNFKNLSKNRKNGYIGWAIGIVIIWILINIFTGNHYSQNEKELIANAERAVGFYIQDWCGSIPSSDIKYSVYKIKGSKVILKCKTNNSKVQWRKYFLCWIY